VQQLPADVHDALHPSLADAAPEQLNKVITMLVERCTQLNQRVQAMETEMEEQKERQQQQQQNERPPASSSLSSFPSSSAAIIPEFEVALSPREGGRVGVGSLLGKGMSLLGDADPSPTHMSTQPGTTAEDTRAVAQSRWRAGSGAHDIVDPTDPPFKAMPVDAAAGVDPLDQTLQDMESTLGRLDHVLEKDAASGGSEHDQMVAHVIRIQAHSRRYIVQMALLRQKRLKSVESTEAAYDLDNANGQLNKEDLTKDAVDEVAILKRQQQIERGTERLIAKINKRHVLRHFFSLKNYVAVVYPARMDRAKQANDLGRKRDLKILAVIVTKWKACATGPGSRANRTQAYRDRLDRARARLQEKYGPGVLVPKSDVQEEVRREATQLIRKNLLQNCLTRHFVAWQTDAMETYKANKAKAIVHCAATDIKRAFLGWKRYIVKRNDENNGGRKDYAGRQRFEQKHNMNKVISHYNMVTRRKYFTALKKYVQRCMTIRQKFNGKVTDLCRRVLRNWRDNATQQQQVKSLALKEWRGYANYICQRPFQAWFVYTSQKRDRNAIQQVIINAYRRKQKRGLKHKVFRMWRHQAIYGKVEGVYSRLELMKTLEEQKRYSLKLEENLNSYQGTIDELRGMLTGEEGKMEQKEEAIQAKDKELIQTQFGLHNAEQEIVRLQAVIDNIMLIHPGTVKKVMEKEGLIFKDRGLSPLARKSGSSNMRSTSHGGDGDGLLGEGENLMEDLLSSDKDGKKPEEEEVANNQPRMDPFDAELLERLKFALSSLCFVDDIGDAVEAGPGWGGMFGGVPDAVASMPAGTPVKPGSKLHQMCGLFEYIRSGELNHLKDPVSRAELQAQANGEVPPDGKLSIPDTRTWHDFVELISAHMPPQRQHPVKDKLFTRIAEFKLLHADKLAEAAQKQMLQMEAGKGSSGKQSKPGKSPHKSGAGSGSGRAGIVNMYASQQPLDGDNGTNEKFDSRVRFDL
jgi:hypothetical protein